ncbi:hypothetical protein [Evansella tamaricis]|uniref:Uncharacterized protein n=1 Tax=Evansella tamaricis TaxID=2069301 RepID=A0ABS6JCW5_9BACI|nr:hypothetical protein [Evansella tamaricis]MBU9711512.1 hypothetical protein [Evansella tamaricis]
MNRFIYIMSFSCLLILAVVCFVLPYTPLFTGEVEEVVYILTDDGEMLFPPFPPSSEYWFGTDESGRDLLQQLVQFGQNTIGIVFLIVFLRFIFSLPLGYLTKNKSGFTYWMMEKLHHYLSGLPVLLFIILFMNLPFIEASSNRTIWVVLFIVLLEVGRLSYLFSDELNSLYKKSFYEASKMTGSRFPYRFIKYDLRHFGPSLGVLFVLELSRVMILLGQMGFLSMFISQQWFTMEAGPLTIQNRFGTWPTLLADTRQFIREDFWIPLSPVLAITFAIITFQLCAESIKRYFQQSP